MVIISSVPLNAQDTEGIMAKSRNAVKVGSYEATLTLIIRDAKGNVRTRSCTMASKAYPDGTEKRIVKFTGPVDVKGTGTLIFDYKDKDDDMWIYLPSLRQTRRVVTSEKGKSYMGSEFSNSDMTAPTASDFIYKLIGNTNINNMECWQIESTPKSAELIDSYGYAKSNVYVSKTDYIVLKTDYFDSTGKLFKTVSTTDYKLIDEVNSKYMVTKMEAINHENNRSSTIVLENVVTRETDDQYFTVSWLEKN